MWNNPKMGIVCTFMPWLDPNIIQFLLLVNVYEVKNDITNHISKYKELFLKNLRWSVKKCNSLNSSIVLHVYLKKINSHEKY